MTSLAHQLKRLALPQNDPSLLGRHHVASLLFDPKEAATIDRETFYALGCTGLEQLMGIDASFAIFEETLFSTTSKNLERSVQTKAVNQQLDENISLFLTHLSPYFMMRPAHKCLEWLIHRFHIHLYNQDSLIGCVLPYYDTKIFVRVIQLLKIDDPTHKWNWLHPIQKPGVPLARSTLITHCYKDMDFLEFICNLVTKSLKAFSDDPQSAAKLRVLINFYYITVLAALDAADWISHTFVAKLLPYIQKGLKSSVVDYKAATYMIICQLAAKTVMEQSLVKALASQLSRHLRKTPSLMREGVGSIIILLQRQQAKEVGKKPFLNLCKVPELVDVLQKISASSYDTSSLIEYLLPNLVHAIVPSSTERSEDDPSPELCKSNLEAILNNIPLGKDLAKLLARSFLDKFLTYGEEHEGDDDKMSELNQCFLPLIRLLENKYPEALDFVLESKLKDIKDQERQDLFQKFIALSTSGGKHELLADCDTSLVLGLNHPQAAVRHLALLHLNDIILKSKAGFDESFIKEAILTRLMDDNIEVLLSALHSFKLYLGHFTTEEMVSVLLSLFDRADLSHTGDWFQAIKEATELIVQENSIKDQPELCNKVVMTVIPHMVFTDSNVNSAESTMAVYLGSSELCHMHPLLKGWPEALNASLEKSKDGNLAILGNCNFSQLLSQNLAVLGSATVVKMVDDLVRVADKDTALVRQKVTLHVLLNALVRGSFSCLNPELQVSLKIFQLLDKRLRIVMAIRKDVADKWLLDTSSGEQMYRIVLTEYMEKLNAKENADMVEVALLMLSLKNFLNSLKCPRSFPNGDTWWNPETMDDVSKTYLQILMGLFDVIVFGASEGTHQANFRVIFNILFSTFLQGPNKMFSLLCLLWTYRYSLSSPLGCAVNAALQTRAFCVGQSLLKLPSNKTRTEFDFKSSPVAVSLLINLANPSRELRRAAIDCLSVLDTSAKQSRLYPLIHGTLRRTEEIIADPNYVVQVLESVFEEMETSSSAKANCKLNTLKELLSLLENPSCPSYVGKTLLNVLHNVNGEDVLAQLLSVLERLLVKVTQSTSAVLPDEAMLLHLILGKFNEHSGDLLSKNPLCLDLFIQALKTPKIILDKIPSFQITAIGQITKGFFSALNGTVQQKILGVLFDLLVESKNPACVQAVNSAFKGISVNAINICAELEPPGKEKTVSSVRQTRRTKMQTPRKPQADVVEEGSVNWSRTTLILELLQHKKKLKEPQHLVPTLFYLLSRCLEPANPEQGNMEYTKQLILSCLLHICQKVSLDNQEGAKEILDEEKFNVELIVQCVRTSEMPQTHHHALLLLGTAAEIFPDKVLHNIMPIFTFMGASVMRLDDSYSFQVISKTVQTVIPALIQAGEQNSKETKEDVEKVVEKIIRVFVDALPHVPEHRRLPILSQLLDIVGVQRFLWVLLVLLFQQHVTKTVTVATNGEKDTVLEQDTEFWISICCEFSVQNQLESLISLLKFLSNLPENKEEDNSGQKKSKVRKLPAQNEDTELFNVANHSAKQLRHFKFLSVSVMANLLASHTFVGKVAECEAHEELQELEQRVLEDVLCYIKVVAGSVEANADKPTAKFWRALLNKSYELLDKVNALLPTETFIPVIRGLMFNNLPSVRRKAMDLLNNKLQHRTQWDEQQIELLLGLVKDLLSVVQKKGNLEGDEQAINRQTALYSLKLLCKCFGAHRQQVFVPVLKAAVDLISAEEPEEKNVVGSALLCIAEITSTIKAHAIAQLPRLMPALLTTLKHRKELLTSEIHLLSTVTALEKVVETLPHFLSPYLQESLLQVTRLDKIAVKVGPTSPLCVRVTALKTTLATKLEARVLLPVVTKCYCHLLDTQQQKCIGSLMDILREHIPTMDKLQLSSHQSELTTFFLKALDYRAEHTESDLEDVGVTEGHIINCFLIMVMKLSEATFRPLFFKLFDWSKTEGSSKDRLLTFCRLADSIADKLKGLFTLFAGHLVKPFADILNQTNSMKTDEEFFESDNIAKSCLLLEFVLNCLQKIFLYDTQHFLSKERAEALMMPLVDQIENLLGGDDKYQARVSQNLVPCIAQFSVAMADDSLWKPLNYQILLKMRHSSPKVRFAALLVLVDLVEKLRENYMVLLPESIPFLAELMEDDCEEVEQQCQKTIKQLETILGESLQSYF